MVKTFKVKIDDLTPSQLYLSEKKLKNLTHFNPINNDEFPVKLLNQKMVLTDGHHRVYLTQLSGFDDILVYWDEDDMDWSAYELCVTWCEDAGVLRISDLRNRILSDEDYVLLWHEQCAQQL